MGLTEQIIVLLKRQCKADVKATSPTKNFMEFQKIELSCEATFHNMNSSKGYVGEENLWKTCSWTRNSDKAACIIEADDKWTTHIKRCDSSIKTRDEGVDIVGGDRRICKINIYRALPMDRGTWTCRMEKCKDLDEGGCSDKDSSSCQGESSVTVTVFH